MKKQRLEELLTCALEWIQDQGELREFLDNYGLELNEEEKVYFEIEDEEGDY